jgi:cyclic beta-1,2-glucan synthetase
VADVYSVDPYIGRGGWTWYTGSASWMYRLGTEMILGVARQGDHLYIKPHIPKEWPEYQISYRFGSSLYHILVKRPENQERRNIQIDMDGKDLAEEAIPLEDDGKTHEILIKLSE